MDPERENRLSIITILYISGISCFAFTLAMRLLENTTPTIFFYTGIITTSAAALLQVLKLAVKPGSNRNKTRKLSS